MPNELLKEPKRYTYYQDLVGEIFVNELERILFDKKIFDILEGELLEKVIEKLRTEFKEQKNFEIAKKRIPYINIIQQTVEKLSRIYSVTPSRTVDSPMDKAILESYEDDLGVDDVFLEANRMYNAHHRSAVEVYYNTEDKKLETEVITADNFIVWSDRKTGNKLSKLFIKIIDFEVEGGNTVKATVKLYSKYEYWYFDIVVESPNLLRPEKGLFPMLNFTKVSFPLKQGKVSVEVNFNLMYMDELVKYDFEIDDYVFKNENKYEEIPIIYCNKSAHLLVPKKNEGAEVMTSLIPIMFADLNYSTQYRSDKIIYTKDVETGKKISNTPNEIANLGIRSSKDQPEPQIGAIDVATNVVDRLKLIRTEIEAYLTTLGLRVSFTEDSGFQSSSIEGSVSSAFDLADAMHINRVQAKKFQKFEKRFWYVIDTLNKAHGLPTFSKEFLKSFKIQFEEIKPVKSDKQLYEEIGLLKTHGLISRQYSLERIYPNLTLKKIKKLMKTLDGEQKERLLQEAIVSGRIAIDAKGNPIDPDPKSTTNKMNTFNKPPEKGQPGVAENG